MKKNFLLCGTVGWCLEILFTAFDSFRRRDFKLMGRTSAWMFPIYGMAAVILPLYDRIKSWCAVKRGIMYMLCIFFTEFATGSLLSKFEVCPWDYSKAKANIKGIIRLDYAPVWFLTGFIYERLLLNTASKAATVTKHVQ